jgi:predicted transcriptional regulator
MLELSKSEYQILYYFYEFNQALTKHELLERLPELNKNTTAAVIRSLLDKGYLKVEEIKYSQNVLARAYRPSIPFINFIKEEYGEVAVEKLVNHAVNSLKTKKQTEYFSNLIIERKNAINKNS